MRWLASLVLIAACSSSKKGGPDMSAAHDMSSHAATDLAVAADLAAAHDLAVADMTGSPDLWIPGTCFDGMKNQNETDVDCGGVCGRNCKPSQHCAGDGDCLDRACSGGQCAQVCPTVNNQPPATVCPGGAVITFSGTNFLDGAFAYIDGTAIIAARVDVRSSMLAYAVWGTIASGNNYDGRITDPARTCFAQLGSNFPVGSSGPSSFITDTPLVWNGITTPFTVSAGGITAPVTDVSYAALPGTLHALSIDATTGGGATVHLANGATAGSYDLVLTDSNSGSCKTAIDPNGLAIIAGAPSLSLTINPTSGSVGGAVQLDITGTSAMFSPDVHVYLAPHGSPGTLAIRATSFTLVDGNHVQASAPGGIATGTYDVVTVGAANAGTVGRSTVVYTATP